MRTPRTATVCGAGFNRTDRRMSRGTDRLVHTQPEAKQFFVTKAIERAHLEGIPLSNAEQRMLWWSEPDPEFTADPALAEQLASEISDEQYEDKIAGLLKRSFAADVAADPGARTIWQRARSVLNEGDHYILVMVDRAVGGALKPWWQFWR